MLKEFIDFVDDVLPSVSPDFRDGAKEAISQFEKEGEQIYKLCKEYKKEMLTEIKLIYDAKINSVNADYKYDLAHTEDSQKTASDDISMEWLEKIANQR